MSTKYVRLSAPVGPYSEELDEYPTHLAAFGYGGYREVATIEQRDRIPQPRRSIGMLVFVQETKEIWILYEGTTNKDWKLFDAIYGQIVTSEIEPEEEDGRMLWLNLDTGVLMYRKDGIWEPVVSDATLAVVTDYGTF